MLFRIFWYIGIIIHFTFYNNTKIFTYIQAPNKVYKIWFKNIMLYKRNTYLSVVTKKPYFVSGNLVTAAAATLFTKLSWRPFRGGALVWGGGSQPGMTTWEMIRHRRAAAAAGLVCVRDAIMSHGELAVSYRSTGTGRCRVGTVKVLCRQSTYRWGVGSFAKY